MDFPKKYTKFRIEDFFQTDVDEFYSGDFMFLSYKKIAIRGSKFILDNVKNWDEYGHVISVYSYTNKRYFKILVMEYNQKAWKNHYHIEMEFAQQNNAEYFFHSSIEEFLEIFNS